MIRKGRFIAACLLVLLLLASHAHAGSGHDWKEAQAADTIEAYQKFLRDHPKGRRAEAALVRIDELRRLQNARWEAARKAGSIEAVKEFLAASPEPGLEGKARALLEELEEEAGRRRAERERMERAAAIESELARAEEAGTIEAFQGMLEKHPEEAAEHGFQTKIEEIRAADRWEEISGEDRVDGYLGLIREYPRSEAAAEAVRALEGRALYPPLDSMRGSIAELENAAGKPVFTIAEALWTGEPSHVLVKDEDRRCYRGAPGSWIENQDGCSHEALLASRPHELAVLYLNPVDLVRKEREVRTHVAELIESGVKQRGLSFGDVAPLINDKGAGCPKSTGERCTFPEALTRMAARAQDLGQFLDPSFPRDVRVAAARLLGAGRIEAALPALVAAAAVDDEEVAETARESLLRMPAGADRILSGPNPLGEAAGKEFMSDLAFEAALELNEARGYRSYLERFPRGKHREQVESRLEVLRVEQSRGRLDELRDLLATGLRDEAYWTAREEIEDEIIARLESGDMRSPLVLKEFRPKSDGMVGRIVIEGAGDRLSSMKTLYPGDKLLMPLSMSGPRPELPGGAGSRWRFQGEFSSGGIVFKGEEREPLSFVLLQGGLTYVDGKGKVTLSDGRVVELP